MTTSNSWGQNKREPSDALEREVTAHLAQECGQCSVKACGAVNVPFVWVRWSQATKSLVGAEDTSGVDKKVCFPCYERLAGLRR